jgi:hypothetical protein
VVKLLWLPIRDIEDKNHDQDAQNAPRVAPKARSITSGATVAMRRATWAQIGPNDFQCAITWRSRPAAPVLDRTPRSARHNEAADLGVKGSRVQISPARPVFVLVRRYIPAVGSGAHRASTP